LIPGVKVYCPHAFFSHLQIAFDSSQIISGPHFSELLLLLLWRLPAKEKKVTLHV
jgi:hypothetical protein